MCLALATCLALPSFLGVGFLGFGLGGGFRYHIPLAARVDKEHAVGAGIALGGMGFFAMKRKEGSGGKLRILAIDIQDHRAGNHRNGVIGIMVM